MMEKRMSSKGLMLGLSASHPATSLPTVLVTPMAEMRNAALDGEIDAHCHGCRWEVGVGDVEGQGGHAIPHGQDHQDRQGRPGGLATMGKSRQV